MFEKNQFFATDNQFSKTNDLTALVNIQADVHTHTSTQTSF